MADTDGRRVSRREFFGLLCAGVAVLSVPSRAFSQAYGGGEPDLEEVPLWEDPPSEDGSSGQSRSPQDALPSSNLSQRQHVPAQYTQVDLDYPIDPVDLSRIKPQFRRQVVPYSGQEWPGTVIIDPRAHHLFYVLEGGLAIRYGVGVGREGFSWSGDAKIGRKAKWPRWTPPAEMVARDPLAAEWAQGMPGGPGNPLGARALYLFDSQTGKDTLYRIHGTNQPETIGYSLSSGCIRMLNQDVAELYLRVPVGSRVIVR